MNAGREDLRTRLGTPFIGVLLILALVVGACASAADPADLSAKPSAKPSAGGDSGAVTDADAAAGLSDLELEHLVEGADTTWDVTYQDHTTVVAGKALGALKRSDDDSGTYTFDASAAKAAGIDLSEGRVLLLAGKALRRITASSASGGDVTVKTDQASLADAIENGTVAWDVPIGFEFDQFRTEVEPDSSGGIKGQGAALGTTGELSSTPRLTQVAMVMPDGGVVPVQSGEEIGEALFDAIEIKPEDGSVAWTYSSQGNKYQFRLTTKGDSVDILVVVSRGGDSPTMAFRAEGSIGSMRSVSSSSYKGGALSGSNVGLEQLSVDLDLSATVAGAGKSPVDMKVPVPMLTYTWLVGPVPVTVHLKADIVGNVQAQANASAKAKSSFTYRGDAGFTYKGTDVSASGSTDIDKMDAEPADSAAPMGLNVDAQFGVAFPSITLSVFGQGLIPRLHFGAVIGSKLMWGDPAAGFPASSICKSAYVRMEVMAGYDLEILGRNLASDDFEIYRDRRDAKADSCPED